MKVVALLLGEPQAADLWTLHRLASLPYQLDVVCASRGWEIGALARLRRMIRRLGLRPVVSRVIGERIIGRRRRRREAALLDRLFDARYLREWWQSSGIRPVMVTTFNGADGRAAIGRLDPDIIVRVSGGLLKPETLLLARIVALNIHHGMAPAIRGIWSIPWGIVEQRPEWIGATIHELDAGIDTGRVVWRESPQLAHGDSGATLFFRAHVRAADTLLHVIRDYAGGNTPATAAHEPAASTYRSVPGAGAWLRYLYLDGGRRAPFLVHRALWSA